MVGGSSSPQLLGAKGAAVAGLVLVLAVVVAYALTQAPYMRYWLLQQSAWQMVARSLFLLAVLALGQDWLLKGLSQWQLRRRAAKDPPATADARHRASHLQAAQRAQSKMAEAAVEAAKRAKVEREKSAKAAAEALAAKRKEEERIAEANEAAAARRAAEAMESAAEGARVAEEVRAARMLRWEQDEAYQQSLRADQERAAKKLEAQQARNRALAEKAKEEEARRCRLLDIQQSLPAEPESGVVGRVSIRIKCQDGSAYTRAFMQDDDVEVLHNWLRAIELISVEEKGHRLVTPYPRTELPSDGSTLAEIGLTPQGVVLLELP